MMVWVLLALVAIAVAAVAAVAVARARHEARAPKLRGELATRHPIVMLHGIAGFDAIGLAGWKQEYFRGIADELERRGAVVYRPRLPWMAAIPERAECLAAFVRDLPVERVNIIAHSMGGLDARYAIAHLGIGDRVAALITIGTPHRGTPVAHLKDTRVAALVRRLARGVGVSSEGFDWLTTDAMARFNETVPDDGRVLYACVVGVGEPGNGINPLLIPTQRYLAAKVGANDGLVSADSQRWGEQWLELDADHYAQIGWSTSGFDAAEMYATLARALRERGL